MIRVVLSFLLNMSSSKGKGCATFVTILNQEPHFILFLFSFLSSPKDMLVDFREGGREGDREEEKHRCARETSIDCLLYMSQPGTEPTT